LIVTTIKTVYTYLGSFDTLTPGISMPEAVRKHFSCLEREKANYVLIDVLVG
jgi:hypothetical protein